MPRKILTLLAALLPAGTLFWLTANPRSPWDGDTLSFLPTAVRYAGGLGLTNPLYASTIAYHPSHDARHIWHGFLEPMLLGALSPSGTYAGVLLVMAFMFALTLGLMFLAGFSATRRLSIWEQTAWIFASTMAFAGFLHMNARPEGLAALLVAAAVLVIRVAHKQAHAPAAGIALGLLAVTSPIVCVIAGIVWLMWSFDSLTWDNFRVGVLEAGLFAILAAGAAFQAYPYTVADWITGLRAHSHVVTHYTGSHRLYNWMVVTPGLGLWMALLLARAAILINRGRTPLVRNLLLGCLVVSIAYFAPDARNYNIKPLMPVGLLMTGLFLSDKAGVWTRRALILLVALMGLPFARDAALALSPAGMSMHDVDLSPYASSMAVSSGMLVTAPADKVEVLIPSQYEHGVAQTTAKYFILQQINPWKPEPPEFINYHLVLNRFTSVQPRMLGVRLANSPRGFHYAVYERR